MKRDHLRLVASNPGPLPVTALETFTFGTVAGDLVVLHNDKPCTAPAALVSIMRVVMPHLRQAIEEQDARVHVRCLKPEELCAMGLPAGLFLDGGLLSASREGEGV